MIRHLQNDIPRTTLKNRRREIEERLAAYGLARGPRRLTRVATDREAAYVERLRAVLESLGPIFSSFGLYLSSRIDLLPVESCFELATIPDRADATPLSVVQTLFGQETGCLLEDAFMSFEAQPCESRLFYQSHAARLKDGTPVVVKIIHPDVEEQISCDVELLPLLRDALVIGAMRDSCIKSAMADFHHALRQQTDFTHEAKAFAALAQDAEEFDMLRAPGMHRDLSTSRVFVTEQLDGTNLIDVIASFSKGTDAFGYSGIDGRETARLVAAVWLRQGLRGHAFPVEPRPENIRLLPDKRIAFTGGLFSSLPAEPQTNLWDYLIAVSTEQPDKACSHLLREIRREETTTSDEQLRRAFRQVVPFRDGVWRKGGDAVDISEYLFAQWRLASECGYLPQAHLPSFFRGLYTATDVARRFAPDYAALTEALRDVRLITSLTELREMISLRQLGDQMDKYAMMMTELPRRLDEVLTIASDSNARLKVNLCELDSQSGRKNRSAAVTALLLVLAALTLLAHNLTTSAGSWGERLSAIVFVAASALLLRVVSNSR